jgi:type I restriction-modification system DNA methylase subunit
VLVLRKCRKHNDSILFIDASNDFEKVKTQNRLLPEHIDKSPIPITTGKRREVQPYRDAGRDP